MKCLVTGAAGFIGSHLCEKLIAQGHQVVGVDCFIDYYPRPMKEKNLEELLAQRIFKFVEADLLRADLGELLEGVDYVFHLAAQAGVRASWGASFEIYVDNNILATQKLIEACKDKWIKRFVFASSSSVYGETGANQTSEDNELRPVSPYGMSKVAGELLCRLYHKNYSFPAISLRYFTAFGPRQRPDMALRRFISAMARGQEVQIYGDGHQTRDFTYVSDVVEANILAMDRGRSGAAYNIGGGARVELMEAVTAIERLLGKKAKVYFAPDQKGEMRHTLADIARAAAELGYRPKVNFIDGLKRQIDWMEGGHIDGD